MTEAQTKDRVVSENREEWFLAQLEQAKIDTAGLLTFLHTQRSPGEKALAQSWIDLLLEALMEKGVALDAVQVLQERLSWNPSNPDVAKKTKTDIGHVLSLSHDYRMLEDQIGLAGGNPVAEVLRRLKLILELDEEVLCFDKTWGFGVVQRVDFFYKKVEIDFDKKLGHELSMAYAAETLEVLGPDHILTMRHNDRAGLEALIKDNPAEVVRMTLRSYGPLPIALLQEMIVPVIIPEKGWKRFWDAARKELKKDGMIEIPSKRNEPIQLLDKEKSFDQEWFDTLRTDRDLETLLAKITELSLDPEAGTLAEQYADVLSNRLAFIVKGSEPRWPGRVARALMLSAALKLPDEVLDTVAVTATFLKEKRLTTTIHQLPARSIRPFLEFLSQVHENELLDLLLIRLPYLEMGFLSEAIDLLISKGREQQCASLVKKLFGDQNAKVEVISWVSRNLDRLEAWDLGSLHDLAAQALSEIEEDYMGERLRAQNQLRERFDREEWFGPVLDAMNETQRYEFANRLKDSPGFEAMDRRSLLAKAIKRYPELQKVMISKNTGATNRKVPRLTSTRSFKGRQDQLQYLVNVEIPENSKEIGVARSYGDLKENHEFKAAKEAQGILMRRQEELERMLLEVKPTNFDNVNANQVSLGTGVVLEYSDGRKEHYYILGEWDRDEDLHIISSTTRMADALLGHSAGDLVVVPTEDGEDTCKLVIVTPPSADVREWLDDEEPSYASRMSK